ncbi:hypothetical protein ABK040_004694 [Willaertia magna]
MLDLLLFFIYFGLLIVGAWAVSEGAETLGEKYDASIVGGLLIASLNTAPETIFFIISLNQSQPTFAVGAISGSVIIECTIAVGLCIVVGFYASLKKKKESPEEIPKIYFFPQVLKQAKFLFYSLVFIISILLLGFNLIVGLFAIISYIVFVFYTLFNKELQTNPKESASEVDTGLTISENENLDSDSDDENESAAKAVIYLIIGGALLYFVSDPFIHKVNWLATIFQINNFILAFFLAPIASEAPEILEAITLSRKGKVKNINIAFSNLVGGTLVKTTLLIGILCCYGYVYNFEWISPAFTVSMIFVLICAGAVGVLGFMKNHTIVSGYVLIGLFFVCSFTQIIISVTYGSNAILTDDI